MHLTFAPRGILQIDDARIIYRNFEGRGDKFNREGDRNFAVVIPDQEMADALIAEGWNVRIKPPRDEDDDPFMFLPVKIKFNDRGPNAYLQTGARMNRLNESSIACLDQIDIMSVDLDIRPYDWEVSGKTGRTAYLQSIKVVQEIDRFAASYEDIDADYAHAASRFPTHDDDPRPTARSFENDRAGSAYVEMSDDEVIDAVRRNGSIGKM